MAIVVGMVAVVYGDHDTMVYYDDGDDDDHDDHDVYDVQSLQVVVNKRLVVVHESKRQRHQMAMERPTMYTMVTEVEDSTRLELVVEKVPSHLDRAAGENVLYFLYLNPVLLEISFHSSSNDY